MNKWLNSGGDPDHSLDTGIVFPDSSLLGDTESGVNRLPCVTLQCMACTSRHRHSNYDVITLPAYGTDIATLVRRASAEVCTLPVFLVKSVWTLSIGKKRMRLEKVCL